MSAIDTRLNKVLPSLSAKERAIHVLQAWKAERDEDPQVRNAAPDQQRDEFNRLIRLMNRSNRRLGLLVMLITHMVDKLELKHGWLVSLQMWKLHTGDLVSYVVLNTKEPVTESDYQRIRDSERSEYFPVAEAAEILMERFEAWSDADYTKLEKGEEREIKDEAWVRVEREKQREIAALVKAGVIRGGKRGGKTLVNVGSFYDWLGEETPLYPDWGYDYEVLPDDQEPVVQRVLVERGYLRESLRKLPFGRPSWIVEPEDRSAGQQPDLSEELRESVRIGICERWLEVRIVETLWDEVALEFNGEDPAQPFLRQDLAHAKARLEDLSHQPCLGPEPVELPEPTDQMLEDVRASFLSQAEA